MDAVFWNYVGLESFVSTLQTIVILWSKAWKISNNLGMTPMIKTKRSAEDQAIGLPWIIKAQMMIGQ